MAGGTWDPTTLEDRAGLYINFVQAAAAQVRGGSRGIVAVPLVNYKAGVVAGSFTTVTSEADAITLFGATNVTAIKLALQGGAKEVLVYALPKIDASNPEATVYAAARAAFEARPFNVFVYDGVVSTTEQDAGLAWAKANRDEGKHYSIVFGCSVPADDQDPTVGDARSVRLADDYAVNLINGVTVGGVTYNSAQYAAYIAGLIAGTALNKSVTYAAIPVDDVTRRARPTEIRASLAKGSLVLVHDGEKVKIERGIATSKAKIRKVRAEQAIASDITKTGADSYIGKLDNNEDGQKALIAAIRKYLDDLALSNVLVKGSISVDLDPDRVSSGDRVFLVVGFVEVDSMEEIYLSINVGGAN